MENSRRIQPDETKKDKQAEEKNPNKPEEENTAEDATPVERPESLVLQNPNGKSTNAKLSENEVNPTKQPMEGNPEKTTIVEKDDVNVEQPEDEKPKEVDCEKTEKLTKNSSVDDVKPV